MKIKTITEKTLWQNFFDKNCFCSFLHSWQWGEFQQSLGYPVIRLGLYNNENQLEAICLIIKIRSKRGSFLFIPHGPVINNHLTTNSKNLKNIVSQILKFLINTAKKENYSFIRIAPILEEKEEYQKIFADLGFKIAPIYMHAETTWELPLTKNDLETRHGVSLQNILPKTDHELLYSMRKTTRYLIKKAIRDGVIIEKTTNPKALKIFYNLYQKTAKREKFTPFSFEFIKREFKAFSKSKNVMIFLAKITSSNSNQFQPVPTNFNYLAASIIFFTKSTAFYHQGASLHTKIPATYLLQWEAIKEAKNRGCQFYNFWGVYDEKRPQRTPKSWQGLTLFKTGFSGHIRRFLPTQDYIVSKKYYLAYLWEKYIMLKRLK